MAKKKLIILVAPTGGNAMDREGAQVPITPEQIAAKALRCREAGAAVVHIHARDPVSKQASGDPQIFSDIIKRIRAHCGNMLIQTTIGIGITGKEVRPGTDERLGLLALNPPQDLATIPPGSWDIWRPGGSSAYKPDATYQNTPALLRKNIAAIVAKGLPWEMEIADTGFLNNALRLADEGRFDRHSTNFWLDYCLGFGAMHATARHLVFAHDEGARIFPQAKWAVLATDRDQFPMKTLGIRWVATSSAWASRTTSTCPTAGRPNTTTKWSPPPHALRATSAAKWRASKRPERFSASLERSRALGYNAASTSFLRTENHT